MAQISLPSKLEEKLVKKAKKNTPAFAPLYQHYYPHIKKYFDFRVSEPEIADDLTADVFEKALGGLTNFQWQGVSFSSWLYRIASNTLIDHYRQTSREKKKVPLENLAELPSLRKGPLAAAIADDFQTTLSRLIKKLKPREQEVLRLKFSEGHTNKSIAAKTGLTETNVGTIVYRAVRKLRKQLA